MGIDYLESLFTGMDIIIDKRLKDTLKTVCDIRIENPELSLSELAQMIGISKSGLNNR